VPQAQHTKPSDTRLESSFSTEDMPLQKGFLAATV